MSRKKNKQNQLPIDAGGLDLTLPTPPQPPAEEPTIDVMSAPSNAHKAVEELETLPPSQSLVQKTFDEEPAAAFDDGFRMADAMHMTPLYLAVRKTNIAGALVLANGTRFWTVAESNLEPCMFEGVGAVDGMREAKVWRPVRGNERGWFVG